jgi:hypothetical protein
MKFFKLLTVFLLVISVRAHQPTLAEAGCRSQNLLECAVETQDPTFASVAIYGNLSIPKEIDVYKFTPGLSETIPVEALVPVRRQNENFRPALVIFGQDLTGIERVETSWTANHANHDHSRVPFEIPDGFQFHLIPPPEGERSVFFEPYSVEKLWDGREEQIPVQAGKTYYIAVFTPDFQTGDYSLGIGTKENFENTSFLGIVGNILKIKMGLAGGRTAALTEFLGVFLLILGFSLGLGASFFGLVSQDKPLLWANWIGLVLSIIGAFFAYSLSGLSGIAVFQIISALFLVLSLVFLSFKRNERERGPRPRALRTIIWQFVALLTWLISLGLFVWYLLVLR